MPNKEAKILKRVFHPFIIGLFILIAVLEIFAIKYYLYQAIGWLDIFMHGLGGFWVAGCAFIIFGFEDNTNVSRRKIIVFLLATTIAVGAAWEILEVSWDLFAPHFGLRSMSGAVMDTIGDMLMDIVGAAFFLFVMRRELKSRK